jgi:hypothetical protein
MLVIKPENCNDVRWSEPVPVQLRYGFPEEIETPLQALNCLAQRWPKVGAWHTNAPAGYVWPLLVAEYRAKQ